MSKVNLDEGRLAQYRAQLLAYGVLPLNQVLGEVVLPKTTKEESEKSNQSGRNGGRRNVEMDHFLLQGEIARELGAGLALATIRGRTGKTDPDETRQPDETKQPVLYLRNTKRPTDVELSGFLRLIKERPDYLSTRELGEKTFEQLVRDAPGIRDLDDCRKDWLALGCEGIGPGGVESKTSPIR